MNTELMFSSRNDSWATPQDFFDRLNVKYGFDLDVCANESNAKCSNYLSPEDNSLEVNWLSRVSEIGLHLNIIPICFMNPPYGREIGKWVSKAYSESKNGCIVVCLLPARTDTKWFHEYCKRGEIEFIKGRLIFGTNEYWKWLWDQEFINGKKNTLYGKHGKKNSAPFPSMLVVFKP